MSEPYKTKKKDIFKMSEETTSLNLDFGKAFGDSFGLLKDNLCLLIVSGLISMLLSTFCFLLIGAMMMGMFSFATVWSPVTRRSRRSGICSRAFRSSFRAWC